MRPEPMKEQQLEYDLEALRLIQECIEVMDRITAKTEQWAKQEGIDARNTPR